MGGVAEPLDFQAAAGLGVQATVEGRQILAGSARLLRERGVPLEIAARADWTTAGKTLVFAATAFTAVGVFGTIAIMWGPYL